VCRYRFADEKEANFIFMELYNIIYSVYTQLYISIVIFIVQKIKRWKPMYKRPIGIPKTRWEDEFWKI